MKKENKICEKCRNEFIPDRNYPKQKHCKKCLKKHNDKEVNKFLNQVFS